MKPLSASGLSRKLRSQLGVSNSYRVRTVTAIDDDTLAVLTTPLGGNQVAQILREMGHTIRHHENAEVIWVDRS